MKKYIIFIILFTFLTACTMNKNEDEKSFKNIRPAFTAGQFYPAEASQLEFKIKKYLAAANYTSPQPSPSKGEGVNERIKAIMVPHAGLDYSGPVAAYAYKALAGQKVKTAVIMCNSHSAYFDGLAVDDSDAWQTPLGLVEVDKDLARKLVASDESINFNSQAHRSPDQTLEVQLPFLQIVLGSDFKIVPIFFGNTDKESYKKLAEALAANLGENDLVIISTDMSHYPAYEDANRVDQETLKIIASADLAKLEEYERKIMSENISGEQTLICGIDGVKTAIELYHIMNWDRIEILNYANSGDALIGDKKSVVGYGAVAFTQTQNAKIKMQNEDAVSAESFANAQDDSVLNDEQKKELLKVARETVENFVQEGKKPDFKVAGERLNWKEGAFVTLHKNGELRGCIGQIVPSEKPLWQVVRDMAVSACSEDHRFSPVGKNELDQIDYEVSVLSAPEPIDDWRKIELGKHGVIVRKGMQGGVFLPQVATETGWSLEEFLSQLCYQKAGLAPDCYKNDPAVELQVYTAQVFGD